MTSPLAELAELSGIDEAALARLSKEDLVYLRWQLKWVSEARVEQIPPDSGWNEYGVTAGRGFGKSRLGAEWIARRAWEDVDAHPRHIIAPTFADIRFVCFEGVSGLLNVIPPELVKRYNASDSFLELTNGALLRGFSAEKPERLRGPQCADIWCLSGDTPVLMADGSEKLIVDVRAGERVMTRKGARRVLASGLSGNPNQRVKLTYGAMSLTCTDDHPILTTNGWKAAGALKEGDEIWSACGTTAYRGGFAPTNTGWAATASATPRCSSTVMSGKSTTGLFLKGITSTTRTMTGPITTSAIWKCSRQAITTAITRLSGSLNPRNRGKGPEKPVLSGGGSRNTGSTSARSAEARSRAGARSLPGLSARQTVRTAFATTFSRLNSAVATIVGPNTRPLTATSGFARFSATSASRDRLSIGRREPATTAGPSSSRSGTTTGSARPPALSAIRVRSVERLAQFEPVYDLTVEEAHEFIAGGIVVHNCDELAAWGAEAEATWDMSAFGLRLGKDPRVLWTSTPKPIEIVRKLTKPKDMRVIVHGSSYDNRANLSDKFFDALEQYEGTDLGRQEIWGELIDPSESAIIKKSWINLWPAKKELPPFSLIVMSLDTAFTEATRDKKSGNPDPTACVVLGVFQHEKKNNIMVLDAWDEMLGFPDLIKRVRSEMQNRYGDDQDVSMIRPLYGSAKPHTSGRCPDILLIESKGSGISLQQMLAAEGIFAHEYNPGRADKLARLHVVSPVFQKKRVWLPESDKTPGEPKTWLTAMCDQLYAYSGPGTTKHDDYIDVLSQGIRLLMDKRLIEISSITELEKADKARTNDWEPEAPPKRVSNPYSA